MEEMKYRSGIGEYAVLFGQIISLDVIPKGISMFLTHISSKSIFSNGAGPSCVQLDPRGLDQES